MITLSVKIKQLIILGFILSALLLAVHKTIQKLIQAEQLRTFNLENLDREIIELNDFIGKGPVLLCFWSSCCKSAVAQVEAFSALYEKYNEEGFVMLAIATDDEKTVAKVKPYVKSKNYKFPVLYDTDGTCCQNLLCI